MNSEGFHLPKSVLFENGVELSTDPLWTYGRTVHLGDTNLNLEILNTVVLMARHNLPKGQWFEIHGSLPIHRLKKRKPGICIGYQTYDGMKCRGRPWLRLVPRFNMPSGTYLYGRLRA